MDHVRHSTANSRPRLEQGNKNHWKLWRTWETCFIWILVAWKIQLVNYYLVLLRYYDSFKILGDRGTCKSWKCLASVVLTSESSSAWQNNRRLVFSWKIIRWKSPSMFRTSFLDFITWKCGPSSSREFYGDSISNFEVGELSIADDEIHITKLVPLVLLLMVQKSQTTTWDDAKTRRKQGEKLPTPTGEPDLWNINSMSFDVQT